MYRISLVHSFRIDEMPESSLRLLTPIEHGASYNQRNQAGSLVLLVRKCQNDKILYLKGGRYIVYERWQTKTLTYSTFIEICRIRK